MPYKYGGFSFTSCADKRSLIEQGRLVPFEVKNRGHSTGAGELKRLREFFASKGVKRGHVIVRQLSDFGVFRLNEGGTEIDLLKIPVPLACYPPEDEIVNRAGVGDDNHPRCGSKALARASSDEPMIG